MIGMRYEIYFLLNRLRLREDNTLWYKTIHEFVKVQYKALSSMYLNVTYLK